MAQTPPTFNPLMWNTLDLSKVNQQRLFSVQLADYLNSVSRTLSSGVTPSAHAPTHLTGGGDTIASATATAAGLVPTPPNNTTTFLRGDATFAQPSLNSLTSLAWTAFTLTATPGAGTITTQSSNSAYLLIGKTVFFNIQITITTIGTASGNLTLGGLPAAIKRTCIFYLRETAVNGLGYSWTVNTGATSGQVQTAGGNLNPTYANGNIYAGFGVYETV